MGLMQDTFYIFYTRMLEAKFSETISKLWTNIQAGQGDDHRLYIKMGRHDKIEVKVVKVINPAFSMLADGDHGPKKYTNTH